MTRVSIPELNSYPCQKCGSRMDVKDSRPSVYNGLQCIRRRRRCCKCGCRVTTIEMASSDKDRADARLPKVIASARGVKEALEAMIGQYDAAPSPTEDDMV